MDRIISFLNCSLRSDKAFAVYIFVLVLLSMYSYYFSPLLSALFLWGVLFFYIPILESGRLSYNWIYDMTKTEKRNLIVRSAVLYLFMLFNFVPLLLFALTGSPLLVIFFASAYYYAFFGFFVPNYIKQKTLKEKALLYLKYLAGFFFLKDPVLYLILPGGSAVVFVLSPYLISLYSSAVVSYIILCERGRRTAPS